RGPPLPPSLRLGGLSPFGGRGEEEPELRHSSFGGAAGGVASAGALVIVRRYGSSGLPSPLPATTRTRTVPASTRRDAAIGLRPRPVGFPRASTTPVSLAISSLAVARSGSAISMLSMTGAVTL